MNAQKIIELTMADGYAASTSSEAYRLALAAFQKDPRQWRFRFQDADSGEEKVFDLRSVKGTRIERRGRAK
jgi:hypothetical protein